MSTMRFSRVFAKTGPPRGRCRETGEVPARRGACRSNASCLDVRATKGFSLVEVLLAIGILSIGLTMVASAFPFGLYQTKLAVDSTNAALAAKSVASLLQARVDRIVAANLTAVNDNVKWVDGTWGIAFPGEDGFDDVEGCFVYNPYREMYALGAIEWTERDPGDYRIYVWLKPMTSDPAVGPWRATLIVCKYGELSDELIWDERANGHWVCRKVRGYAYHLETRDRYAGRSYTGSTSLGWGWVFRNVVAVYYTYVSP